MAKATKKAVVVKRLVQIFNVSLEKSPSGVVCELPGWSLTDYTRTGKLGLWNICRLLEVNRLSQNHQHYLTELLEESPDGANLMAVVGAQKTTLSRKLNKLSGISCPMLYSLRIGYIGNTSLSFLIELHHRDTGILMASNERQLIFIDSYTRKPHAVPPRLEQIKDKYPPTGFLVQVRYKPKDSSKYYRTVTKIVASDMDNLYHTNQSIYYRITLDAAHEAGRVGFLQNFAHDICEYDVREFHGKHTIETFAGDEISVYVWEDEDDKLILHFEIRKTKTNDPVMYQTIKFYPLNESHL